MRPILPGARGPAVEDIQQRLLKLGFDLGRTGIDGVFLGKTREAVEAFQAREGLADDGVVGDATWAALVDATFTLGDRMLYLRLPHLHGHDVAVLQQALNTLGFACGDADGIFGRYTGRATREFQRNCGQPDDGIAGSETVRAIIGLRHVWEGKDAAVPVSASTAASRRAESLPGIDVWVSGIDPIALDVADRVINLAAASDERARVHAGAAPGGSDGLEVVLAQDAGEGADGVPVVLLGDDRSAALAGRLMTARAAVDTGCGRITICIGAIDADERERQRAAVRLLDALGAALA